MKPAARIGIALLIAGAGAAWAWRKVGQGSESMQAPEAPVSLEPEPESFWPMPDFSGVNFWIFDNWQETENKAEEAAFMIDKNANIRAFLHAIARAEGTAQAADPYRVCYAYKHTIQSFADHPANTGEWKGEPLSAKMCKAAGLGPGCVSTAAGKYQIIRGTWNSLKKRLKLADFSPASQDAAAIELLRQAGALEHAEQGRIADAVKAARRTWASLPGAGYEQPERSLQWVTAQYTAAGGVLA